MGYTLQTHPQLLKTLLILSFVMVCARTWETTWAVLPTKQHPFHQLVMTTLQRIQVLLLAVLLVIHATGT